MPLPAWDAYSIEEKVTQYGVPHPWPSNGQPGDGPRTAVAR